MNLQLQLEELSIKGGKIVGLLSVAGVAEDDEDNEDGEGEVEVEAAFSSTFPLLLTRVDIGGVVTAGGDLSNY